MLPARCRVAAVLAPSSDSHIEMELWMPAERWNGKFQFVGGGGWAGTISFPAMAAALQEGYATASTDTGHKGGNALFAIGHPEKLVDFAYRAVHETAVQSKALINAHYGRAPRLSYWNGCSTGGRQGLMSAQRYPEDFDAIVAGAPANYQTHLHAWDLAVAVPTASNPAAAVPAAKLQMVNRAVINACDARDGVTDGLLNDPRSCTFDVASLQCKAGDAESCLTADQVASMKRASSPARTANVLELSLAGIGRSAPVVGPELHRAGRPEDPLGPVPEDVEDDAGGHERHDNRQPRHAMDVLHLAERGVAAGQVQHHVPAGAEPNEEQEEPPDEEPALPSVGRLLFEQVQVLVTHGSARGAALRAQPRLNSTFGTARSAASSISQSSAGTALANPAIMFVGNCCCLVL
jgi:hypothetical protein